ncbi:regulator of microtubule dynamics protein 2 [Protopterus annectens]|uniref:regulator of microtubule dynamics protein 2 n=1 Tax=Protopterus annectens TaxID=7888 RepID=UPI001CFC38C1|nr:regulator of microtubule dynamics protein 2 [Protopterus annectens]
MSLSDAKSVMVAVLAGAAGISLAVIWYKKMRHPRTPLLLSELNSFSNWNYRQFTRVDDNQGAQLSFHANQGEILEKLNCLIRNVEDLKEEIQNLKEAIPKLEEEVHSELRGEVVARRVSPAHRAAGRRRTERTREQSEQLSTEETESEGGYITAQSETDEDSEEEKLSSKAFNELTLSERHEELIPLLQQADNLHNDSESCKREGFALLFEKKNEYGNHSDFLWRLARAYGDMFDLATDKEEKKTLAMDGKSVALEAVTLNPQCPYSHQWFALMCGYLSEYETIQNKIKNGYLFKEHLDKAIELQPQNPLLYYLLGRWCYAVAQLSWIERKVAAALFGNPPSATIQEALHNFLKVEELQPQYSKFNYVYLAKCFNELGQRSSALKWCNEASSMPSVTKDDYLAEKELETLLPLLTAVRQ